MTQADAGKLIYTIKASYPRHFDSMTTEDLKNMILSWAVILDDVTYDDAAIGLKIYIRTDRNGFPPSPGQIIDNIQKTEPPEMLESEAWGRVRIAIKNGIYGAEEEFEKLPPDCQKAVGRPGQLREWAMMPSNDVDVTAAAHFKRAYATVINRKKEEAKMPQEIRDRLATIQREALSDSQR